MTVAPEQKVRGPAGGLDPDRGRTRGWHRHRRRRDPRAAALALVAVLGATEARGLGGAVASLQVENDLFGNGLDRHYTNGLRLNLQSPAYTAPRWSEVLGDRLQVLSRPCAACTRRVSFALGQSIYTPEDITRSELIADDRPYAGWLYAAVGLLTLHRETALAPERLDTVEFNLGVVGPASLADEVQQRWHELIAARPPRGWHHQLDNEPGVNAYVNHQWRLDLGTLAGEVAVDLHPHLGYALGNVHTHAGAGATLRLGNDLRGDFGPPRIRPSPPGGGFFTPREDLGWYLFAGVEGRYVARNIFLDGNTFEASHRVTREPWIADLQYGVVVTWGEVRASFTNVRRSREFAGQQGASEYGALTLSWTF